MGATSMSTKSLWIIEDVVDLQPIYHNIFPEEAFKLTFFLSFEDFKKAYVKDGNLPQLIIADIMLSDGHFFKLLNESDLTLNTPYLVISSSDDRSTISNAYDAGAVDYLLKPFNQNEIRAKVEHHLQVIEDKIYESTKSLEALKLNLSDFTNKEIKIIESFNHNEDKTLHRNEIVKLIWKNIAIHPNTLDVHIYNLRKKLKNYGHTIKAIGNGLFKFIEAQAQDEDNSINPDLH